MEEAKSERNTGPQVVVKKIIAANRERVFQAWTDPEVMQHWFVGAKGTARATVDLRVGGRYENEMFIEGHASCQSEQPASGSYLHFGEYLEILRPEKLVFTWNSPSVRNTKVTVELRQVAEGTEVTITHELELESDCSGHRQGWSYALETLSQVVSI